MLREENFLAEAWDTIKPFYFGEDDLVLLAEIVVKHASEHSSVPNRDTLESLVYQKCQAIDRDGALGKINRLSEWLNRLYAKEVGNVATVKDQLRHFARRREVLMAMIRSIDAMEGDRPEHGDKTIERIQGFMNEAFQIGTAKDGGVDFHDLAPRLPEILQHDALHGRENKVPTGIREIDEDINGGIGVGELGVLMAPPNRGKTTVLCNFAAHAARILSERSFTSGVKKSVVFVTLEMHEEDIGLKLASIASHIPMSSILTQRSAYEAKIVGDLGTFAPINIKFWSPGTATVDDIKWYISNLKMIHGQQPGVLLLDYADLLRGGEDNRFWGMGEIYKGLIALGNQFGFGTWTGSQVRRADADDKTIRSTGAAESWKKVELADVMISLNQTDDEYEQGLMRFYQAKVRRGKAKSTYYQKLHADTATICPLSDEDKANLLKLPSNERTPQQDRNALAGASVDIEDLQARMKTLAAGAPPPPPAETNGNESITP
jgi:replicative DNA helicase